MVARSALSPILLLSLLVLAAPAAAQEPAEADTSGGEAAPADTAAEAPTFGPCPDDLSTPVGAEGIAWGDTAEAAARVAGELDVTALSEAPVDSLLRRGDRAAAAGHHTLAYAAYAAAVDAGGGYGALWRASRAATDVGQDAGEDAAADWYERAEEYARGAVEANPRDPEGHLELARALGLVALDANARERVRMSEEIRAEARAAIEADSSYAGGWHVLGRWHKGVMELSGLARMFARTFLGGEVLGEASWENAERYLARAAELEPGRILHHLELGKVYRHNDKLEQARQELRKAAELPPADFHDCRYRDEARQLLAEMES